MEETSPHRRIDGFDALIDEIRVKLLPALVAKWGIEVGSDLCSDVEEYAWEHRAKVTRMENPLGYLYRVAQSKSRSHVRWIKRTTFPVGSLTSCMKTLRYMTCYKCWPFSPTTNVSV
jgi:DNA-directed RNA polymerase specialized sigma24 family protein